ncbi:MAG: hypothetical protein U0637_00685 [Phycisphaerales bacterium]
MRPSADDIRVARWMCACVLRVGALVMVLLAVAGLAFGWGEYSRQVLVGNSGFGPTPSLWQTFHSQWVLLATGAGLALASLVLTRALVPAPRPGCPSCGYDTSGLAGKPCPECGRA